jgi:hypothetical protein
LSQAQTILVVVRQHCTCQDNSGRIGSPRYKNLKIRKERERKRGFSLGIYRLITVTCSCRLAHALGLYSRAVTVVFCCVPKVGIPRYRYSWLGGGKDKGKSSTVKLCVTSIYEDTVLS